MVSPTLCLTLSTALESKFCPLPMVTGHPGQIFNTIVPHFLLRVDHAAWSSTGDHELPGNWDVFFNVLNVETEDGATGARLRAAFYG